MTVVVLPVVVFRQFYLNEIDRQWLDQLEGMDNLRTGIGLRGYGNRDPKREYKNEGYKMFTEMMATIKANVIQKTFHVDIGSDDEVDGMATTRRSKKMIEGRGAMGGGMREPRRKQGTVKRDLPKVGRNDPCPCGSGKKYKKCCGKTA